MISYELARLVDVATSGRPGPVWLDIPLDLQNFAITNPEVLPKYLKPKEDARTTKLRAAKFRKIMDLLKRSKRPCLLVGNGCRTSAPRLRKFLEINEMPIITGWNARDLITGDPNLLGSAGLFGNRAANLAIQKADLVIGLGYRFSVPQVGYDPSCYAPNAVIAAVDIDPEVGPGGLLTEVSYFNRLERLNSANREIIVIKPSLISEVVAAFREAIRS